MEPKWHNRGWREGNQVQKLRVQPSNPFLSLPFHCPSLPACMPAVAQQGMEQYTLEPCLTQKGRFASRRGLLAISAYWKEHTVLHMQKRGDQYSPNKHLRGCMCGHAEGAAMPSSREADSNWQAAHTKRTAHSLGPMWRLSAPAWAREGLVAGWLLLLRLEYTQEYDQRSAGAKTSWQASPS
eukprot:1158831-Pelagomonas_calceolata.AAC.7